MVVQGLSTFSSAQLGGQVVEVNTVGPDLAPVIARILFVDATATDEPRRTAYIEAADSCGLQLASMPLRALSATSIGLAAVLRASFDHGAQRIVVGVGGTASTDGGEPVVQELGSLPDGVDLVVASDVENVLLGPSGAARSFAPQKGATPDEVSELESRLTDWAQRAGGNPDAPGAGAGGGLAFGLLTLGARRVSGAALVAEASRLGERIAAADLVITGEGAVDFSSLRGKVVCEVGRLAMAAARPCVVLAGRVEVGRREAAAMGLAELHAIVDRVGQDAALADPAVHLEALATAVASQWRA